MMKTYFFFIYSIVPLSSSNNRKKQCFMWAHEKLSLEVVGPWGCWWESHLQYIHLIISSHSFHTRLGAWRVLHHKDVSGCRMLNVGPRYVALSWNQPAEQKVSRVFLLCWWNQGAWRWPAVWTGHCSMYWRVHVWHCWSSLSSVKDFRVL